MKKPKDKKAALAKLGITETTTDLTGTDVYMSLVRFERLAVVKWFEHSVEWLMDNHGEMEGTAALVFVHLCREGGMNHRQAFSTVTAMTNREIIGYFAAEDSEDLAATPAGKGGSTATSDSTSSPTTEPDSASPTA